MSTQSRRKVTLKATLACAGVLSLSLSPCYAEGLKFRLKKPVCPETYEYIVPEHEAAPAPAAPAEPAPVPEATDLPQPEISFDQYASLGGSTVALSSNVGYIDNAIVQNQFRFRYDTGYGVDVPDRAEFFYAKCGCFTNGNGPGPALPETNIDYQDLLFYGEIAYNNRISGFVELPVRFLNPEINQNITGVGDMTAGIKAALYRTDSTFFTFQLKNYIPTGYSEGGLGTDHVSIEPGFLFYTRLTDRLAFEAEVKDWISVNGTNFSGNVLRYGVGLGYDVVQTCSLRITPTAEVVGWTVLEGLQSFPSSPAAIDASGVTIVNIKPGIRATLNDQHSFYVGYGRALTGSVWYEDIVRAEYRITF